MTEGEDKCINTSHRGDAAMQGWPLFESLKNDFIGLKTHYPLADGRFTRRHYLDSAASTLALGTA
jgi:hypothetical protein